MHEYEKADMNVEPRVNEKNIQEATVLPENVYHSYLGEYFLGQTDLIPLGGGYNGWGSLVNPAGSKVNMFLNAYTISNYSNEPLTVDAWLSSKRPGRGKTSSHFAAGNQAIHPARIPEGKIRSASFVSGTPQGGTHAFVRRVEPMLTLTKHDFQGIFILPPGSSFTLSFLSPGQKQAYARIAYGWWEEEV